MSRTTPWGILLILLSLISLLPTGSATARETMRPTGYANLTAGEKQAIDHWRIIHLAADDTSTVKGWNPKDTGYTVEHPTMYAMTSDGTDTSRYLTTPAKGSGWYDTDGHQVAYADQTAVEYRHTFQGRDSGTIITYTIRQQTPQGDQV